MRRAWVTGGKTASLLSARRSPHAARYALTKSSMRRLASTRRGVDLAAMIGDSRRAQQKLSLPAAASDEIASTWQELLRSGHLGVSVRA